jgi:hypothetical protein
LSFFRNVPLSANRSRELWRRSDWEILATHKGVGVIYLHGIGGKDTDKWAIEYDTACRNGDSSEVATLELAGRDLYISIFSKGLESF